MPQLLRRIGVPVMALGLFIGVARPAHADLILTMTEVGSDVMLTGSGTANLDALILVGSTTAAGQISPSVGAALTGPPGLTVVDRYAVISGPNGFGVDFNFADAGAGDVFGAYGLFAHLFVPSGYMSGTSLTGSSTFAFETFASMGARPGTYVWTWGTGANADSLTLQIGPAAVPEPVSLSLLASGVAGFAVRRWRRRTASQQNGSYLVSPSRARKRQLYVGGAEEGWHWVGQCKKCVLGWSNSPLNL